MSRLLHNWRHGDYMHRRTKTIACADQIASERGRALSVADAADAGPLLRLKRTSALARGPAYQRWVGGVRVVAASIITDRSKKATGTYTY